MSSYLLLYRKLKNMLKNSFVYYNFKLKNYSTFKIGGRAKVFVDIGSLEDIIKLHSVLSKKDIPYFVLGNGSNTLISSSGYNGVVIYFGKHFSSIAVKDNYVLCDSGAMICAVYGVAKDHALSGLEGTAGLPASVGGMVYMNASCFGFESASVVHSVLAMVDGRIKLFSNNECNFGYRDSTFQHMKDVIILKVQFCLTPSTVEDILVGYKDTLQKRLAIQPKGNSCGCVFRRMPGVQVSKMLDELGMKGVSFGSAVVSDKHANFILNNGDATSNDVVSLIHNIQDAFYEKYKMHLNLEIKYLGDQDEIIR
ncbi:MAG: UDP-N-acetylmuramate dehydrogenase [Clostridia bacterium]|nr:UDP-N-acetylmuramate dehydrogenase [Clostridia bacterium]